MLECANVYLCQVPLSGHTIGLSMEFIVSYSQPAAYIVIGLVAWVAVLKSGVHVTLAGFAIEWFIPLKLKNQADYAILPDLEHSLHLWAAFMILPLFAFANAGVSLAGVSLEDFLNPVPLGIEAGLFIGK